MPIRNGFLISRARNAALADETVFDSFTKINNQTLFLMPAYSRTILPCFFDSIPDPSVYIVRIQMGRNMFTDYLF